MEVVPETVGRAAHPACHPGLGRVWVPALAQLRFGPDSLCINVPPPPNAKASRNRTSLLSCYSASGRLGRRLGRTKSYIAPCGACSCRLHAANPLECAVSLPVLALLQASPLRPAKRDAIRTPQPPGQPFALTIDFASLAHSQRDPRSPLSSLFTPHSPRFPPSRFSPTLISACQLHLEGHSSTRIARSATRNTSTSSRTRSTWRTTTAQSESDPSSSIPLVAFLTLLSPQDPQPSRRNPSRAASRRRRGVHHLARLGRSRRCVQKVRPRSQISFGAELTTRSPGARCSLRVLRTLRRFRSSPKKIGSGFAWRRLVSTSNSLERKGTRADVDILAPQASGSSRGPCAFLVRH